LSVWGQWQALRANPVYLRERGAWGNPNPFYAQLTRYSPFVVIGAILFGVCAGGSNPTLFAGGDSALAAATCFLCLPGFALTAVSLYAQFMAPALTAPSISLERAGGTWDILRLTPLSMRLILFSKLFGGLSRLRIWPILFALSALQGGIMFCSITLLGEEMALWGGLMGLATVLRPWSELLFAAFVGMYFSAVASSAMIALVGAYAVLALVKLFNSSGLWAAALVLAQADSAATVVWSLLGPVIVYGVAITAVALGISHQAKKMSE
jgi:hypothetical protein